MKTISRLDVQKWTSRAFLVAVCLATQWASAQDFPAKPIKMVIPFPAGGGSDFIGRPLAAELSKSLGQNVVIENRDGASGAIGAEYVMRSKPDGYTLLYASSGVMTTTPLLDAKLRYHPERDFLPVALVLIQPYFVFMHPTPGIRTVQDLIAYARANPGKLQYGSTGIGGIVHLATELFNSEAKVDILHVPYKGLGPLMTDFLAGRIHLTVASLNPFKDHVKAGKVIPLVTTAARRMPEAPDVPTAAEVSLPRFKAGVWYGMFAPAGTPRPVVTKLNGDINRVLAQPDMKEKVAEGWVPATTPEQFGSYLKDEKQAYAAVIKTLDIKLE